MAIDLKQSLKLTQQLVMTPQLQQAIKLLQLSRLELSELINQQMTENPVLEEDRTEEPAATENEEREKLDTENAAENSGEQSYDDVNWEEFLDSFVRSDHGFRYSEEDEDRPSADTKVAKGVSLCEHLLWQLRLSDFNKEEEEIAEYIIGNLDEDGYLKTGLDQIAQEFKKGPEQMEKILQKVQGFDPAGVASRDLQECLLIQLRQWQAENPLAEKIVSNHMKELEKKDYRAIARKEKAPIEKG